MKRVNIIGFILGLMLIGSPAYATLVINDWTMDLSGIDGIAAGTVINDISQITYIGTVHSQTVQFNNPEAYSVIDGLLNATAFVDAGQSIIPFTGLNNNYQLTFDFSIDAYNADIFAVPTAEFTHLAPTNADGLLDIWVDGPTGGITPAAGATGFGFQDGVKIATFKVNAGEGGVFSLLTYDGSDDASFTFESGLAGVFFDADGNDLVDLGNALLAITDSNLDANPDGIQPIGFNIGGAGNTYPTIQDVWIANTGFSYNSYGTSQGFFAEEDGSARLAVIPEPSTFILLGAGLLGLGIISRKRKRE